MFRNASVIEVPDVPAVDVAVKTDVITFPSQLSSAGIPAVDVDVPPTDARFRPSKVKWYEKQRARIEKERAAKAEKDKLSTLQSTLDNTTVEMKDVH